MELDRIFAVNTVLAGITCLIYNESVENEGAFLKSDYLKFLFLTLFSGVCGFVGGTVGLTFVTVFPQFEFLSPLASSATSLCLVSLLNLIIKTVENGFVRKHGIIISVIFATLQSSSFRSTALNEFLFPLVISVIIYICFASLLYGACSFLVPRTDREHSRIYPKIMILSASIGFAAEGFKGIFENLFT